MLETRKCATCSGVFSLNTRYVAYGGIVWCSEDCLAKFVVERDLDAARVEQEMEIRSER